MFGLWDEEVDLHLGALDEINQFRPSSELWTVRREGWLPGFGKKGFVGIGRWLSSELPILNNLCLRRRA